MQWTWRAFILAGTYFCKIAENKTIQGPPPFSYSCIKWSSSVLRGHGDLIRGTLTLPIWWLRQRKAPEKHCKWTFTLFFCHTMSITTTKCRIGTSMLLWQELKVNLAYFLPFNNLHPDFSESLNLKIWILIWEFKFWWRLSVDHDHNGTLSPNLSW